MSGLLDKAKTASSPEEKSVNLEPKPVKKSTTDGLLTKANPEGYILWPMGKFTCQSCCKLTIRGHKPQF